MGPARNARGPNRVTVGPTTRHPHHRCQNRTCLLYYQLEGENKLPEDSYLSRVYQTVFEKTLGSCQSASALYRGLDPALNLFLLEEPLFGAHLKVSTKSRLWKFHGEGQISHIRGKKAPGPMSIRVKTLWSPSELPFPEKSLPSCVTQAAIVREQGGHREV